MRGYAPFTIAAAMLAGAAAPANTQQMPDSYTFLKAVREADGAKAADLLSQPGSTVSSARDPGTGENGLHIAVRRRDAARPAVVACTLLPYDAGFELGATLAEAARPVPLNHPHCARFCVLGGAACSR